MLSKKISISIFALLLLVLIPFLNVYGFVKADENLNCKANLLMDFGTGEILSENNSTKHLPIASVTKLTTLLLAFEALESGKLSLDQKLIASENASGMGGSQVFIDANAEYTVENLLHAIVISSANDACVVIAEEIGGSEQGFVDMMNDKAKSLSAMDTNYTNCTGLPSATAYSCAKDVALIMREVLNYPKYFEISKIWMEDFEHPSGRVTEMANTNKLLRSYKACDAGKTGSTNEAGFCMSASAKKGDTRLIAVVLGAENSKARFGACADMFDWGFANFVSTKIIDSNEIISDIPQIAKAKNNAEFVASEDYFALCKKGEDVGIQVNYEYMKTTAPISQGEIVGKIILTKNNVVVKEIDIISNNEVQKKGFKDTISDIFNKWKY